MKKLFYVFLLFSLVACKDDDASNETDPIIGQWSGSSVIEYPSGTEIVEIEATFSSNGNSTSRVSYDDGGEMRVMSSSGSWRNNSTNPDFSASRQTYIFSGRDSDELILMFGMPIF